MSANLTMPFQRIFMQPDIVDAPIPYCVMNVSDIPSTSSNTQQNPAMMNKNGDVLGPVGRKEISRPRNRSVYTASNYMVDDIPPALQLKYEGNSSHSTLSWNSLRQANSKTLFQDDYAAELNEALGPYVTAHGTISLRLREKIRVDISLDKAIRIINFKSNIALALSSTGSSSALIHPNGRVFQYGSRVEILAIDSQGNNKYAKMWYKGVSFTSDQCALVYLVDSAGTRTTTDTFSDLSQDFSLQVFFSDSSQHGPNTVPDAVAVLQQSQYWVTDDLTDNWIINSVRISQTTDGLVRIGRNSNKFSLRTSPGNGSASVSSPYMHCTGSMGQTRHLFVRRGERRMHYDGSSFIVRNAGHSAGFDDKHQLKVY